MYYIRYEKSYLKMTTFNLKLKKTSFFEQTIVGSSINDVTAIWGEGVSKIS
jgi:hypothetical protein